MTGMSFMNITIQAIPFDTKISILSQADIPPRPISARRRKHRILFVMTGAEIRAEARREQARRLTARFSPNRP